MAFFAISVAMLGMTAGSVFVYMKRDDLYSSHLPETLARFSLYTGLAIPASILAQFCLITTVTLSLTTIVAWGLLLTAMAVPYVFSGVVVSLALTRSPFPAGEVYGADLLGAALGCVAIIAVLNFIDAPSAVMLTGATASFSAWAFAKSGSEATTTQSLSLFSRPTSAVAASVALLLLAVFNSVSPVSFRPVMVKDNVEKYVGLSSQSYEKWNSYSRIRASAPKVDHPRLWGPSPKTPVDLEVPTAWLNIDGLAGTEMYHFDGRPESVSFLEHDLVNLAYRLPGVHKSAVIGVGGGRDILSAHYFDVADITGVELNPIFVELHTKHPLYSDFSNLKLLPNLKLYVDDARTWFASTHEKFDLVQMSMIDTWAATGAGAFSLSENGLYTVEGWRAFLKTLDGPALFTVSRWYSPGDVNETGRMTGLATAALLDAGVTEPKKNIFVAHAEHIATLIISKTAFREQQLRILEDQVEKEGFGVLLAPNTPPASPLLGAIVESRDLEQLDSVLRSTYLDLTVPVDSRPFFFNQLRLFDAANLVTVIRMLASHQLGAGVLTGNLIASLVLTMILILSVIAVVLTILIPLRGAARKCAPRLALMGSAYFSLLGMGFMFGEIALLQYFSVYLGHPTYSLSVCLFSLILASGLGSLASVKLCLDRPWKLIFWGGVTALYLALLVVVLPVLFQATTDEPRLARILISLGVILPLGFLLGFGFPSGMRLVEFVDREPAPWFWGVNGATGVLASVLGVMISMGLGIHATLLASALCYLAIVWAALGLFGLSASKAPVVGVGVPEAT